MQTLIAIAALASCLTSAAGSTSAATVPGYAGMPAWLAGANGRNKNGLPRPTSNGSSFNTHSLLRFGRIYDVKQSHGVPKYDATKINDPYGRAPRGTDWPPTMIICSCNVLSEEAVRTCLNPGPECPRTPSQVQRRLDCSPQCSSCFQTIRALIDEALNRTSNADRAYQSRILL